MTKTGIKTFICSFVLSLFMIFSINGVFFRESLRNKDNVKISHKNITLFLKNESFATKAAKVREVKKIALSVPEKMKPSPETVVETSLSEPKKQPVYSEVAQNHKNIVEHVEIPLQKYKPTEKNKETEDILPLLPRPKEILKAEEIKVASLPPALPRETEKNVQNKSEKDIPLPLIPLEKGNFATKDMKKDIQVASALSEEAHIALSDAQTPIASMKTEKSAEDTAKWVSMKEKKTQSQEVETPWVMAKASNHPVNRLLKEEKFFKDVKEDNQKIKKVIEAEAPIKNRIHLTNDYQLQLASKTVDNILIPIPQDILEDENLTPKLVSSDDERSKEKEAELEQKYKDEQTSAKESEKSEPAKAESSIFDSLNSIFSSMDSNVRPQETDGDGAISKNIKKIKDRFSKNKPQRILPVEMRLSFQPGRAEISGQTLRWIKAFANKAKQDETTAIEVRISGTDFQELQQKRVSLLSSILAHDGVGHGKVNMVFTDREPNSFIIRTIKVNNKQKKGATTGNKRINRSGYYLQW